jgi:hypothetical protein
MKTLIEILLPTRVDNTIRGSKLPVYLFAMYTAASMARSLIHLLAPDGGAGSIAGIDLSTGGAEGIIFAFGLWGSSQVMFALIQFLVVVRYRSLVPLMYLMLILEVLLRELVGVLKPVSFIHPPPGAVANQLVLPLAALMLGWSLWSAWKEQPILRSAS